jgi:hypothetical protein
MKKILIAVLMLTLFITFTGCSSSTTNSSVEVVLSMQNFVLCESVNGERDYVERSSKTFKSGENAYAYFEITGFKYKKGDGKVTYHPVIDALIKDSDGNTVIPKDTIIDSELNGSAPVRYLYFYFPIPTDGMKDGKYTLTIYAKDALGSGHLQTNEQFIIKSS